ncbi:MAG: phosphoenolpyruvate--protein phosphotransferase [Anaerolineae bacterium]
MVGIVIVSHSAKLAEGIAELARQMMQQPVALATAGGIDDPDNPIGTDPMRVFEAITSVYSEDGVLVLMDLGSALMSAETALEFLEPEQRERVLLCPAPVVEGTVAATVQASIGSSLQQVMDEALSALQAKIDQLAPVIGMPTVPTAESRPVSEDGLRLTLNVTNRLGLHARPAARFVSTASQFDAQITVTKAGKTANARSINQIATLGVRQGDKILVEAHGPQAAQALAALQALANDNFGDIDEPEAPAKVQPSTTLRSEEQPGAITGIPASPGIAVGPVVQYRPRLPEIPTVTASDPEAEWQRLHDAIRRAAAEIEQLKRDAAAHLDTGEAAIFDAHLLILQDPDLHEQAQAALRETRHNAERVWVNLIDATAASYRQLDDPYMQARAQDIEDVGNRVLRQLMGVELPDLRFETPSILVARDLTPSDTARLDPERVLAICTETGGATAHSAILARALGIPAIVGAGPALAAIPDGQVIGLDGETGQIWTAPDETQLAALQTRRDAWLAEQQRRKEAARAPAITTDAHRIEIAANIGGPKDVTVAIQFGAEGVGLFRTEFLFMDRAQAPTEDEQLAAYRAVAEQMAPHPVIIRTLDIGGDKPLPYLPLGTEDNPFLGWRGIRFCLDQPDLFKTQLRAILRANAATHNLKLMFPMVSALSELKAAKALLAEAAQELAQAGIEHDSSLEVGIMIEVPSSVAIADQLAREAAFFSIGTNDLTQYVMAADRGNARVADLADAFQPAVLRMVQQTVQAGHAAGIWVGMCGELAGNALAAPLLVGLGLDELSMSAPSIPAVKAAIRRVSMDEARRLAENVLAMDSAEAITEALNGFAAE